MPNFVIRVPEVHITEFVVEAVNEKEAVKKANEMIEAGDRADDGEYSHTLDTDEWTVQLEQ